MAVNWLAFFGMFDKLDDIIYRPVDTICSWLEEPLNAYDAKREQDNAEKEMERRIRENNEAVERDLRVQKANADIKKILDEADVERGRSILNAMLDFQQSMMSNLNEASMQINMMGIDIRNKALEVIKEKTQSYNSMQEDALERGMEILNKAAETMVDNPLGQEIMARQVEKYMGNILDNCNELIKSINKELENINKIAGLVTEQGLEQMKIIAQKMSEQIGSGVQIVDAEQKQLTRNNGIIVDEVE